MQAALIATLVIHLLAGVFWAGSTFAAALLSGAAAERLFRPQMAAAIIAVLAGVVLWSLVRPTGVAGQLAGIGGLCAILAAGVQGAMVGRAARELRQGAADAERWRRRMALGQRIAALLLLVTVAVMAASRFA